MEYRLIKLKMSNDWSKSSSKPIPALPYIAKCDHRCTTGIVVACYSFLQAAVYACTLFWGSSGSTNACTKFLGMSFAECGKIFAAKGGKFLAATVKVFDQLFECDALGSPIE